jgi:restriction system protein
MADDWKEYQEEAAEFFRSLGLSAETDVKLDGVRTSHDIDVVVKSKHVGFEILWLVECKYWKSPVSKLHVLGLREITSDLGADRGILLCEAGFQSGAIEAANLTNVRVTTLASLSIETRQDVSAMRLRELYDRVEHSNDRYWALDKPYRKSVGLRPGPVTYLCRPQCSFRPLGVRRPRGFCLPMLSADGAGYRSR